jgi:hypothetical protein
MNGRELYELIQENSVTLSGNWVVDENDNLSITGYTQPTKLVFDQTLGKVTELVVEWDTTCLGAGGYIHSNLSPVFYIDLDFNPADEGHGNKFRILTHNCDYTGQGNNVGSLMQIPPDGSITNIWATITQPNPAGSVIPNTRHTFRFEKRDGYIKFYEDDVLLNSRVDDYTNIPLYFGWYFWFGSSNTNYSANFIIHSYTMSGRNTAHEITFRYAGSTALARVADIVKNYVDSSNTGTVHVANNETITGIKTFTPGIVIGTTGNICRSDNTGTITISSNVTTEHGGRVALNSSGNAEAGNVTLTADDGTNAGELVLYSDNRLVPSTTGCTLGTKSNRFAVINGLPSCSLGFPGKRTVDFINVMIAVSGVYDITISAEDVPADGYLIMTCDPTDFTYCVIDQTDGLTTTTGSSDAYASMGCDVGISMPVIAGKDIHIHCKGTINTCIWRECKDNEHIGPSPNEIWIDVSGWNTSDWWDNWQEGLAEGESNYTQYSEYGHISAEYNYGDYGYTENTWTQSEVLLGNKYGYFVWDITNSPSDPDHAGTFSFGFRGGASGYIMTGNSSTLRCICFTAPGNDLKSMLGGKIIKVYDSSDRMDILD